MEILNVRETAAGYSVNGYIDITPEHPDYPAVMEWVDSGKEVMPALTAEEIIEQEQSEFRAERDGLLTKTDIYMLIDKYNLLTATQQTELTTYRQALRDSTTDWVLPTAPTWL